MANFAAQYRCPLCHSPLVITERSFRCHNNHSFDLAKEGYVNLLPVQHKKSKAPGDNKVMVNARRNFLSQGHYQPLIDKLIEIYQQFADMQQPVLDAGSGEGYYTNQHCSSSNQVYGVDIAKEAVRIAAKSYPDCHFSVGTLSQLPFDNSFFGWVYSIYAPILEAEFTRVLQHKGFLLTVTPAQAHLHELKQMVYKNARAHDVERSPIQELKLVEQQQVSYTMELAHSQDRLDLLAMTPFAFKATDEVIERLGNITSFQCQADFLIRLYQKD